MVEKEKMKMREEGRKEAVEKRMEGAKEGNKAGLSADSSGAHLQHTSHTMES